MALYCWLCIFSCLHLPAAYGADIPLLSLQPFISNGGYALEVDGRIVRAGNLDTPFIPASTLKVLTSLMALEILGPDYRFATRLFQDEDGVLYIRGEGDPLLTSEAVTRMAHQLKDLGISEVAAIVLDDTAFALEGPPPGSANTRNPYDAHSGALVVNFNALPFTITPALQVVSGEKQTPLLPMMKDFARHFPSGRHRVNVSAVPRHKNHSNVLRYSGELITALFREAGVVATAGYSIGKTPDDARPLLIYSSETTVAELVRLCLHYSNNFIANQLYLSCGWRIHGFPATWAKAQGTAREFIGLRLKLPEGAILMEDGSGLSTSNSISPSSMLTVLQAFAPYATLLKKEKNTYLKSGTLTGVYSYVGYFESAGRYAPFVLFLNQMSNNRRTMLRLLEQEYAGNFHDS